MSFRPTYFGAVALPGYAYKVTGGPKARNSTMRTISGFHDADGTYGELELPYTLTYSCLVYQSAGIASLGGAIDDLRAMIGQRQRLYMTPWDSTTDARWAWARCIGVNVPATVYNRSHQPIDIEFLIETTWRGYAYGGTVNYSAGYLFGNGLYYSSSNATTLTGSPQTLTAVNNGNYWVDDAGITITAGDAALTYVKVGVTSYSEFEYTGSITAGNSLIVDCGKRFVRANGVDAYESFQLTSSHAIAGWMKLLPSESTSVVVTYTGGGTGSTAVLTYSEAWA